MTNRSAILLSRGFIADIIVGLIGSMFGEVWADRRAARRQESGRVDCRLRVIAGSHQGRLVKGAQMLP